MNRAADIDQLISRNLKYFALPAVIAICVWILILNVPSASLTAFIAASGIIVGLSAVAFLGKWTRDPLMKANDPEAFIKKRVALIAAAAVTAICIAGAVTMIISGGV